MDPAKYGPFANIVGLACALVATFSLLLVKALGGVKRWTWLVSGAPSFLVSTAARVTAVAVMASTYVLINESNFKLFLVGALACGILGTLSILYFDRQRKIHILSIPLVGDDGKQITDRMGRPQFDNVVIGQEKDMIKAAQIDLAEVRRIAGGVSLPQFMSGYGAHGVNDAEALWPRELLARRSSRLTMTLVSIALFAVTALFLSAFAIEVAGNANG